MSELSSRAQAEELAEAIRLAMLGAKPVNHGGADTYYEKIVFDVPIPLSLAQYLHTGLDTRPTGDVTVVYPDISLGGADALRLHPPQLKLAWEFLPGLDVAVESGDEAGRASAYDQSGFPFKIWRALGGGTIISAAGFKERMSPDFFQGSGVIDRAEEAQDQVTLATARAEAEAWERARIGVTDPSVFSGEAIAVIALANSLPRDGSFIMRAGGV